MSIAAAVGLSTALRPGPIRSLSFCIEAHSWRVLVLANFHDDIADRFLACHIQAFVVTVREHQFRKAFDASSQVSLKDNAVHVFSTIIVQRVARD